MMKGRIALAASVVAAVAAAAGPAQATNAWGGYHWARTANPFTIQLGDNVTSEWTAALQIAGADWSADTAKNPLDAAVVAGAAGGRCNGTPGRVEVCSGDYGNNGWLGLAQIWVSKGPHINQATAKVNDRYYSLPKYDTAVWRSSVVCQEVGHAFGLDHQDTSGADFHTCMDYANDPAEDNAHPNRHDYAQLAAIYSSHLDSSTNLVGSAASTAPVSISRSDAGRESKFVERFADGSQRITWITWAR